MRRVTFTLPIIFLLAAPMIVTAQSTPTWLEINKPILRRLSGSDKHVFQVNLQPEQFLHVSLMQDGIDVVITVFHPDGTKLLDIDSPVGKIGLEEVRLVADTMGAYRIEIDSPFEPDAGNYEIKIEELRRARPNEKKHFSEIQALIKLNSERLLAESREDKNTLFRIYADEVLMVSPNDRASIGERRAILSAPRLGPPPSVKKTMTIKDVKVLLSDDTAVVGSIVHFTFNVGEQSVTIQTCYSDTYVKRTDRWQLLATHPALIMDNNPSKAKALVLDTKLLDEYTGEYQLSPTIRLLVYKESDKLIIEGVGGSVHELVPESANTFLIKGSPTKHIFVRDGSGKVTHLVMNAMGQELKAVKIR